jgi:hypothetical protein
MTSPNIYRVRFTQNQRYAINISAPSAELAEFFAEEIRKRAGTAPFEAIGEPFSGDWQSEEICSANIHRPGSLGGSSSSRHAGKISRPQVSAQLSLARSSIDPKSRMRARKSRSVRGAVEQIHRA